MTRSILTLLLAVSLTSCGQAAGLEVKDLWARDTIGGTANAAVFMTIRSDSADRLVAASSPAAKKTDLMTMQSGGDAMAMAYVKAIDVGAGAPVSLNPRGLHVWLAELNRPLKAGESFPLFLTFEKAGQRRVDVTVIAPSATPPG